MKSSALVGALRTLFRAVLALAGGICTGVALIVAIEAVPIFIDELQGRMFMFSSWEIAEIAARTAFLYAVAIALIASPIWGGLRRVGRNNFVDAAALGFVLTFASWCIPKYGSVTAEDFPLELVRQATVFGLAGAASGIVTWLLSRPKSQTQAGR
jgi:hypothetical protein